MVPEPLYDERWIPSTARVIPAVEGVVHQETFSLVVAVLNRACKSAGSRIDRA